MKSLKQHIEEGLRLSINDNPYSASPKTWKELRQIIEERFEEFGPGTKSEPIDFNDIDVSKMTTFYDESSNAGIFEYSKFEYINVYDWNVSNVTNMKRIFYMCKQLKSLDLSNWNVSNVENVGYIFSSCINLESIGYLSKWNVSRVNNMTNMFYNCEQLESVGDLSNWNVSNVKDISFMFCNCHKLKSVGDLSNWNISNVESNYITFDGSGITNIPKWYKE